MKISDTEIRHTICDICCPSFHCGLDVYVQNGRAVRIEGMKEHPVSHGRICTKGLMNRQYIYHEDRLKTPMRRVGKRGDGQFEPISWEEAYQEIADKLKEIKNTYGPESVLFYSGYSKWYRPFLHRLANQFGTPNFGTESSNCMFSTFLNWMVTAGCPMCRSDVANSGVFLGWAFNPYGSRDLAADAVEKRKAEGMKVIIVDPRITTASQRLADLHLRPRAGTDGALALGIAHVLIREGMTDEDYIERYVYGYEKYRDYVMRFTPEETELLTGVPAEQTIAAARMIGENLPLSISESAAPIAHHENGFQNYRAIMALSAITGCFDRKGGQIPVEFSYNYQAAGLNIDEDGFINAGKGQKQDAELVKAAGKKQKKPKIGQERFPLWSDFIDEMQTNDLIRQLETGEPYPIKAVIGFGVNYRIGPDDERLKTVLMQTEFLVNTELFMTDTCRFCDLILPVCSSLERSELKVWPGGHIWYTKPVIEPIGESRSDVQIICDLAKQMELDDPLLKAGPEACYQDLIRHLPISLKELQMADGPVTLPAQSCEPGAKIQQGLNTRSGKFELYSLAIEGYHNSGLQPLPIYQAPREEENRFRLCSVPRLPGALHSRLHRLGWSQELHPEPTAELHPKDAEKLGVEEGDFLELEANQNVISMRVHLTRKVQQGSISVYHGYPQADVNRLLNAEQVDPYSGFPAFRSGLVQARKKVM